MLFDKLAPKGIFVVIFVFWATCAHTQSSYRSMFLTAQEVQRLKEVRVLLDGVDNKSLQEMIREMEKSPHPLVNLEIREAMAKTYTDIVREIDVKGKGKREWLYSMVCLNMAYLQFGGSQGKAGSTTELNRLIRRELIKYLPSEVLKQPGFIYSLE